MPLILFGMKSVCLSAWNSRLFMYSFPQCILYPLTIGMLLLPGMPLLTVPTYYLTSSFSSSLGKLFPDSPVRIDHLPLPKKKIKKKMVILWINFKVVHVPIRVVGQTVSRVKYFCKFVLCKTATPTFLLSTPLTVLLAHSLAALSINFHISK